MIYPNCRRFEKKAINTGFSMYFKCREGNLQKIMLCQQLLLNGN